MFAEPPAPCEAARGNAETESGTTTRVLYDGPRFGYYVYVDSSNESPIYDFTYRSDVGELAISNGSSLYVKQYDGKKIKRVVTGTATSRFARALAPVVRRHATNVDSNADAYLIKMYDITSRNTPRSDSVVLDPTRSGRIEI